MEPGGPIGPASPGEVTGAPPAKTGGLEHPESQVVQPCEGRPVWERDARMSTTPQPSTPSAPNTTGHAYIIIGCTTLIGSSLTRAGWLDLVGDTEFILENTATFNRVKQAIKNQQVSWLHIYLDTDDATKKATQLARAHERSRGLWLKEACGEWTSKSSHLRALAELEGVLTTRADTRICLANHAAALPPSAGPPLGTDAWLADPRADHTTLLSLLLSLPHHRLPPHEWLITKDVERATAAALQQKRQRAQADAKAIGGLRNPAVSIDGDSKAQSTGDRVRKV